MKLKGNAYVLIIIMTIMVYVIITSLTFVQIEPKLFPLLFGSSVLILAAVQLAKEIRTGAEPKPTAESRGKGEESTEERWRAYLVPSLWILGFVLVTYLVGFLISIPLFIISFTVSRSMRWYISIVFATVMVAVIYGVFQVALQVPFPWGLVGNWLSR